MLLRRRQRHRHRVQRLGQRQLLPNTIIAGGALIGLQHDGFTKRCIGVLDLLHVLEVEVTSMKFFSYPSKILLSHLDLGHLRLHRVPNVLRLLYDGVRPDLALVRVIELALALLELSLSPLRQPLVHHLSPPRQLGSVLGRRRGVHHSVFDHEEVRHGTDQHQAR